MLLVVRNRRLAPQLSKAQDSRDALLPHLHDVALTERPNTFLLKGVSAK